MAYRCTSALILGFAALATARADSVLEFQTTEFGGGEPIVGTVQISTAGSNTRLEIISLSSAEAGGMIFHGERREMIILDHAQGNYMVISQPQLDAKASKADGAMAQRQQAAPEPPPATINDLGSHGEVAGISCRNYEVMRGGRKVRELCVSDWGDIHGGQETAHAMQSVAEFFDSLRQAYAISGGMEVIDRQEELFEHMRALDGYPVLYRDFSARGSLRRQTLLTGAREETLAPGFFEPPDGYTLQALPTDLE